MGIFITILVFIVCLLLIGVILIQNPKGGGLSSSFSSTGQIMGVRKTNDFLEKATWTLAVALLVLSLLSAAFTSGNQAEERKDSEIREFVNTEAVNPPAGFQQQQQQVPTPQQGQGQPQQPTE